VARETHREPEGIGHEGRRTSVGTAENKAVLGRIIEEVINRKNLDLADELYSDEHELHPEAPGVGRGPEGMRRAFAGLHEEFPDVRVEIESMVAEGDMVAVRLTFSGTHAATGEPAAWPEMVFTRFSAGKAVESWEVTDTGRSPSSPPW
jgi:predicted SnoaL-like aldol condensation-catalyzing enzyme